MRLIRWMLESWFLVCLLLVLPAGMLWGWTSTAELRRMTFDLIHPGSATVVILFLMSFSLDSTRLREALRSPSPVVWGTVVNIAILPLMAWPAAGLFTRPDLGLGLMIAAVVPCTLATASVSTRQAGGNDAVSLLVTLLSNAASVGLTPFWLKWTIAIEAAIDPVPIVESLALTVLFPTIVGQSARALRYCILPTFSRKHVDLLASKLAQVLVLMVVAKAAVDAGARLRQHAVWPTAADFTGLAIICAGLHVAAMLIAEFGGRWLKIQRYDRIATVFAGSQKTLPVGLLMASMPAITGQLDAPFITFPILLFHANQLLMDTAIADWIARRNDLTNGN